MFKFKPSLGIWWALVFLASTGKIIYAGPVSESYELKNYSFGGGGIIGATSSAYSLHGFVGEADDRQMTSDGHKVNPGLIFSTQANLPEAPTLTNPGNTYDRLKFVINTGNNPDDAEFAIAISKDNWSTTQFIQNDYTIGSTLGSDDWLNYTGWGGVAGKIVTGLDADSTYKIKVKARHGDYTETAWSAEDSAITGTPSLTFGAVPTAVIFDELEASNSWSDSTKSTVLTTSTNAYNGYIVYAYETSELVNQDSIPIEDFASPNSAPQPWTGEGFGYSTNDSNLTGGLANRFTSGGPKYAGFTTSPPGDPVADHVGPILENPIEDEEFSVSYRVTASATQPAGRYTNSLIYIVVPTY